MERDGGDLVQVTRSAREFLNEAEREIKVGQMLKTYMTGGAS